VIYFFIAALCHLRALAVSCKLRGHQLLGYQCQVRQDAPGILSHYVRPPFIAPSHVHSFGDICRYPAQNYQGASKLIQATQSCMQPTNAMSYILRSADDEKARVALEAAKAKKAVEDAKAAAAKKSRDEAAAKAAAEAKKLSDQQEKAKKDAADLLALKTERKRLQIKARNDALSAAKAKLDGHKYQMGLAEKNLNAVLADESAALRKWKELGESTEQARAHLEAIRARNRQAIAAYEEAKRLHESALNEFNARSKVGQAA
jgi:hypothetical protein